MTDRRLLLVDGNRVAVELRARMSGKASVWGDCFTFADSRVARHVIRNVPPIGEPSNSAQ